jgi:glycosyltransferase involved in cell wall biosynthesis
MKTLMYVVTDSMSSILLRGQLSFFRKQGFRVILVSSPGNEAQIAASCEGVEHIAIPMKREISPFHDLLSLWYFLRLVRRVQPDIVNAGTPKASLIALSAAWLCGVKHRYFTLRGLRSDSLKGFTRLLVRWTEKLTSSLATRIICISPSLLEHAESHKIVPLGKGLVLRKGSSNGVQLDRFTLTPENFQVSQQLRENLGIPRDAFVVGFVGRIVKDKGLCDLLEAFQELEASHPNTYLVVVGRRENGDPLPGSCRQALEKNAKVVEIGYRLDLENIYPMMDVVVLPSYREGFGNVLLEASAMGLPVIASDIPGCRDAVVHGETGFLVPPKQPEKLAATLGALISDEALRKRLGRQGRQRAVKDFAPEQIWRALLALYQDDLRAA